MLKNSTRKDALNKQSGESSNLACSQNLVEQDSSTLPGVPHQNHSHFNTPGTFWKLTPLSKQQLSSNYPQAMTIPE